MGGADPGKSCVFPFKFRDVIYTECTLPGTGGLQDPWCSTLTDERGQHVSGQGKWGNCAPECLETTSRKRNSSLRKRSTCLCYLHHSEKSRLSGITCTTVGGADPGKSCVFPFSFRDVVYTECTLVGTGGLPDPWCSTLTDERGQHVSGQGKWGNCPPECLETTAGKRNSFKN